VIGGETFEFTRRDTFVVPSWHAYALYRKTTRVVQLFDRPVQRALGCSRGAAFDHDENQLLFDIGRSHLCRIAQGKISGSPHLLRRPQLRRACARDGQGSGEGAAVFLMKPADAWCPAAGRSTTRGTQNLHHEIELVVASSARGATSPQQRRWTSLRLCGRLDMTRATCR